MNYNCEYSINFDSVKRMTVVFTVHQVITRDFLALKDFFTVSEDKPEGETVSCGGDTYPTMILAIRAIKARLLVQYGITEDKIIFSGIQID